MSHFSDSIAVIFGFAVTSSSIEHEHARQAEFGIFELFKITSPMTAFSFLCPTLQTHGQPGQFRCQHGLLLFDWLVVCGPPEGSRESLHVGCMKSCAVQTVSKFVFSSRWLIGSFFVFSIESDPSRVVKVSLSRSLAIARIILLRATMRVLIVEQFALRRVLAVDPLIRFAIFVRMPFTSNCRDWSEFGTLMVRVIY